MMFQGFKFGLLLQFAVGPVCLFIFQTAISSGLKPALIGVLGVTLVDGLFIGAAILGIGTLLRANSKIQNAISLFGGCIVILFGFSTFLGAFSLSFLPSLNLAAGDPSNVFKHTLLLTLSNPLTILFWAGVFSAKLTEESLGQVDMVTFGTGAALSTLVFLSVVSFIGSQIALLIPQFLLFGLNAGVGVLLQLFGLKILCATKLKQEKKASE